LPLAQGYNSILIIVDWLTKMAYFILTTEKILAKGLARLFRDNIWKLHRLTESIISDSSKKNKRDVYYDKQVERVVIVLNCMLKGL